MLIPPPPFYTAYETAQTLLKEHVDPLGFFIFFLFNFPLINQLRIVNAFFLTSLFISQSTNRENLERNYYNNKKE